MAKAATAGPKAPTKSEILTTAAEHAGISRKQAAAVLESLSAQIQKSVGKKGPGLFTVPGLMKIKVHNKAARKAYKGIDRFTGVEKMFKAKPASRGVRVRPLKALKDFAK